MSNRRDRVPGRTMRRAGPVGAVLATVGIALGAWVGIAPASDADEPPPASVTSVGAGRRIDPPPIAAPDRPATNDPEAVAPRRLRAPGPGRAGVVTPGKPYVDRGVEPTLAARNRGSAAPAKP
ncbi:MULTISPECIES: hypothetical protein [unclassified Embleya]|uniref:hypothetical protein n=1 Tax=unclassified Embleya TaxID=2699296 RepID=UPI0033FDE14F